MRLRRSSAFKQRRFLYAQPRTGAVFVYSAGLVMESNAPTADVFVDAALQYAAQGFYVFPCHDLVQGRCSCGQQCASPGKHPRTRHGLNDSTLDAVTIKAWWRLWPYANIAIDCGRSGIVVVDVDVKKGAEGAATMRWFLEREELPFRQTRTTGTPSGGYHFYFKGSAKSGQGTLGSGVDVRGLGGYVLAPPSVVFGQYNPDRTPRAGSQAPYVLLHDAPLAPFPAQLLQGTSADSDTIAFGDTSVWTGEERTGIPHGQHRQALLRFGWNLRCILGFTIEAALPLMRAFLNTLEGYDKNHPFHDRDLRGMLTKLQPHVAQGPPPGPATVLDAIMPASDVLAQTLPPRQIVIPGLLVRGELHVLYGPDGVGKTSLVAYMLALVSRQGRDVLVFISEDQPRDFTIKYHLSGGDLDRLHLYNAGRSMREFLLPKCKLDLEAMLQNRAWGAVYFDSINDYKNIDSRLNAADEARQLFGPLSTFSQTYDATILCTAHTNARDVLEGARQIRAKARVVARVERPSNAPTNHNDGTISFGEMQYDPLWTAMVTTEKYSRGQPGTAHAFLFEERVSQNPYNGQYDYEIQPDGTQTYKMQYICTQHERMAQKVHIPRQEVKTDQEAGAVDLLRTHPGMSFKDFYSYVGGDREQARAWHKKAQAHK